MHAFDSIQWATRSAELTGEQVEAPAGWSDGAVNVVASRYFRGAPGDAGRERSVRELIRRVGGTLAAWVGEEGLGGGDFEGRLLDLLVRQRGAFNSPVWFNVGIDDRPQCSACFILSVEDHLESILDLARVEGLIFQRGSGAGTNLSTLRSSREALTAGGRASGPVSFMRGYDAFAGVVKSGGRTRRAAKMQILEAAHPDIRDFVASKAHEEKKARALAAAGFSGGLDGEAYQSVAFQNSNLSVRAPDAFFDAVRGGGEWETVAVTTGEVVERLSARELLASIAQAAWECGDPGLQYDGAIQAWHGCPNSGRIRASNPCSEYLFLDDTSCNLASLNLLAYLRADGVFDIAAFRADVATLVTAMETIVGRSSYPTPRIAERVRMFRPLGLGYANLGALLMSLGMPYDSPEARDLAASITALLTGEAYRISARLAEPLGAFDGFAENRAPFLAVLERHAAVLGSGSPLWAAAREAWEETLKRARRNGVRNAQATVLAPTGTIAFLMDCDTTGIEPDLSLVKYKRLVGGGTLRLTNRCVPAALRRLGYGDDGIAAIVGWLEKHESIEGAPGLKERHLPVFDCAFGARAIRPDGHLEMMAAVQPFLSGGISKTVNLAATTTPDEIAKLFLRGHELGLKALAVYREGSKGAQPLSARCLIDDARDDCCG